MAVKIRLRRMGANNDICFRVIATDSRSPRDGRCLEVLGWYDPRAKGETCRLKLERIEYWKGRGAVMSETVASLVRKAQKSAMQPAAPA